MRRAYLEGMGTMNKLLAAAAALSMTFSVSGSAQSMPTLNQSSTYTEEILATRPYRILYILKGASAYTPKDLPNVTNGGFFLISR